MMLIKLLWSFLQIGLFSIGGGYAALPLIHEQVVDLHGWLTDVEFADLVTISQMTPGPIAINAASFVGARMAGIPGSLIATFGCVLPPFIIISILARLYMKYNSLDVIKGALKGLRPAVVGLIASAGFSIISSSWLNETGTSVYGVDIAAVLLFVATFFVMRKWKKSPILVICGTGIAGLIIYSIFGGAVI
ncbi:MAG: chromate transporter [Clostridiales bacterium]|jgi:chromate transporter|nr:chromate transporter [Clostridiales bacterium]